MQEKRVRRSNAERSRAMQVSLLEAARTLFLERGYEGTSTPDVVAAARVTRGALYHHFEDKKALFRAVVTAESALVAAEIEAATADIDDPITALREGGRRFLDSMTLPGRTRLLLVDAPAVLGRAVVDAIDAAHASATLRIGLQAAIQQGVVGALPINATAQLLSAAYDRAALALAGGDDRRDWETLLDMCLNGLTRPVH